MFLDLSDFLAMLWIFLNLLYLQDHVIFQCNLWRDSDVSFRQIFGISACNVFVFSDVSGFF